jgi:hypothetical protein
MEFGNIQYDDILEFLGNFRDCYEMALEGDIESQYELSLLGMTGMLSDTLHDNGAQDVPLNWIGYNYNHWLRQSAEQDFAPAQCQLGENYLAGDGIEKNLDKGIKWLRKAAEQNYDEAQYLLGKCYDKGQGVPKDHQEAIKWYAKAAEQGLAKAQYKLGCIYINGDGVEVDYDEGIEWLQTAAEQHNEDAKRLLDQVTRIK